jgi:hypothetical protein
MSDRTEPRPADTADGRDREDRNGMPRRPGTTGCTEPPPADAANDRDREGQNGMPREMPVS